MDSKQAEFSQFYLFLISKIKRMITILYTFLNMFYFNQRWILNAIHTITNL